MGERFPRELTRFEREVLLWILPKDRPGYNEYRKLVDEWSIIAEGRRGEGNYLLGPTGAEPDNESPLPQILSHGSIVTTGGELSVSMRERLGNQVEIEITGVVGNVDPAKFEEIRRWTLSSWLPTQPCPACGFQVREISMSSSDGRALVLAVCPKDRKLWVYDEWTGVNHPIPVTNYYNELMLHKNIRDPKVVLNSNRLFIDLSQFDDRELRYAFQTYNKLRTKVAFEGDIVVEEPKGGLLHRLKQVFRIGTQRK